MEKIITTHTYYIDPTHGQDANDGLSPLRPLKNHEQPEVHPGDTVLFNRGSVIRGPLRTHDGAEGVPVTYGAYGDGEKPAFLGSVAVGNPADWTEIRAGVWRYAGHVPSEVCNLVFNAGDSCGILRWRIEDLQQPGDWHHTGIGIHSVDGSGGDPAGVLYLCSAAHPGTAYADIECVLWGERRIVGGSDVILENLSFRNSGVHGYFQVGARNVVIRDCDFRHIGGAAWSHGRRIRFGNAIELWNGAWDVVVEGCTFEAIYDSGITHQGGETRNIPARLHFRHNRFTNCGMAAYECREPSQEVYFEHNLCVITGGGFGLQGEPPPRQSEIYPQPMGHHVFIWRIEPGAQPGRVYLRNNRFGETPHGAAIYSIVDPVDERKFILEGNTYAGRDHSLLAHWGGCDYRMEDFARYQEESGKKGQRRIGML